MYRACASRALVVLAVMAASFLLGRFLSSTASFEPAIEVAQTQDTPANRAPACAMEESSERIEDCPTATTVKDIPQAAPAVDIDRLCLPEAEEQAVAPPTEEPNIYIPPCPEARSEAPAFMPYIEEEAEDRPGEVDVYYEIQDRPPAKVGEVKIEAPAQKTGPCCTKQEAPAPAPQGAPDVSRYEHLLPNPKNDEVPARSKIDTMDFRPSDARRGAFDPQPL